MELHQLRCFLKTAQTLNYTKAAEELFTSRQALRHTLGNLERELGQSLFFNDHNRLSLTEHGEYLLHTFQELVAEFERREEGLKAFFQRQITLQVVFSVSLFPFHLPNLDPWLKEFLAGHPQIRLEHRRVPADEVAALVEAEEVDLGVVLQMPNPRENCSCTVLRRSPVSIGSGKSSPLFGRKVLTPKQLSDVPLIGMGSLEVIARPLWEECRRQGIKLNYRVVPNTIDALFYTQNSLASCFNTFFNFKRNTADAPEVPQSHSRLEGYDWELAALGPRRRENHAAALLLAEFLRERYEGL